MKKGNLAEVRERLGRDVQVGDVVDYLSVSGPIAVPMPKRWIIRRTAPNREFRIMRRCEQLGLSAYLPTLTSKREFRRCKAGYEWIERRHVASPLITGAILIPDFEVENPAWKAVDGLLGILRFGEFVPMLTPALIADIRCIERIGSVPKSKRPHYFEVGQLVRVVSGPFKDFSARVERLDTGGRISVGIEIFSRITPAIMEEGEIEAV